MYISALLNTPESSRDSVDAHTVPRHSSRTTNHSQDIIPSQIPPYAPFESSRQGASCTSIDMNYRNSADNPGPGLRVLITMQQYDSFPLPQTTQQQQILPTRPLGPNLPANDRPNGFFY
jgi:hypothetical protein